MHENIKQSYIISYVIFAISIIVLVISQWSVLRELYFKWIESGTYAHGIVIFPISLYLIYTQRHNLNSTQVQPYYPAVLLIALLSIICLFAKIASVIIIQEFVFIMMIHAVVLGIFGIIIYKKLLFPLMYLFFAVPCGHFLISTLQDITAHFASFALKLSGLTIYHDKWYISTTRGDFEVVAACSGVRYLIASIALSVLFSQYAYSKMKKRIYFIFFAIIFPIFANCVRAYLIILVAHLTYLKVAVGIDHLIYGWMFFGIVMFILFWIGAKYADLSVSGLEQNKKPLLIGQVRGREHIIQLLTMMPILIFMIFEQAVIIFNKDLNLAYELNWKIKEWKRSDIVNSEWHPLYQGALTSSLSTYEHPIKGNINAYVGVYGYPEQNKEAVSSLNVTFDKKQWILSKTQKRSYDINSNHYILTENQLHGFAVHQLVWHWYEILGVKTSQPMIAKGLELLKVIIRSKEPTVVVVMSASYYNDPEEARAKMLAFMRDSYLNISKTDQGRAS